MQGVQRGPRYRYRCLRWHHCMLVVTALLGPMVGGGGGVPANGHRITASIPRSKVRAWSVGGSRMAGADGNPIVMGMSIT